MEGQQSSFHISKPTPFLLAEPIMEHDFYQLPMKFDPFEGKCFSNPKQRAWEDYMELDKKRIKAELPNAYKELKKVFDAFTHLDRWKVIGLFDDFLGIFTTYLAKQLGEDNEEVEKLITEYPKYIHVIGKRACTEEAIEEAMNEICPGLFPQDIESTEEDSSDEYLLKGHEKKTCEK